MFVVDAPAVALARQRAPTYEERVARLARADFRVVYLYEKAGDSTFRYRVTNMIQALEHADKNIAGAYFTEHEFGHLAEVVERADALVVCRVRYNGVVNSLITAAKGRGKPVFFDVDDLVFNVDYAHLLLQSIDQDLRDPHRVWDSWFASIARVGTTLRLCDRVITTNGYLAEKITDWAAKPVDIIPNFLNDEQVELSRRIFESKKKNNFTRHGKTCIGYFSGSPTHDKDFAIAASALAEALENDSNLVVRVVGFLNPHPPLDKYRSRLEFTNYVDYLNLQRLVSEVEINLVPLQDNAFCQSKSELKYFEAAIVGTLTVASPTYAFRSAIRDGENGYLANRLEWSGKLSKVLDATQDYPAMAQRAFEDAEARYCGAKQAPLIEKTLRAGR